MTAPTACFYRYVAGLDEKLVMPPVDPRLTGEQVERIRQWIDEGARWPEDGEIDAADSEPSKFDQTRDHWALHAGETDQPIGALISDLKRTGLWDETLVVWGGEFGRTPTSEGVGKPGRDHNWLGFSMWLAGAGVKGGQAIGATDELGFRAVDNPWHVSDMHATILHLVGLDHTKLTYFSQGLDQRLTGVRGEVIRGALT